MGAIDCANDDNMPTCREFEVMGYPTLKFFPPKSGKEELGEANEGKKEVSALVDSVLAYLDKAASNASLAEATRLWPDLKASSR